MRPNDDSSQESEDSEYYNPAGASGSSKRRTNKHSDWEQLQRVLDEQRPPITEDDYDIVLGPTEPEFDEWWTEEDERRMMQEWRQSPEKTDMEQMKGLQIDAMGLWAICLRLYRCSPFAILSPRRGLKYELTEINKVGITRSTIWTQAYCRIFGEVMVHTIWRDNLDILVAFLQFAVICRTDDRRPWERLSHVTLQGLGLDGLAQALGEFKDRMLPRSILEIQGEVWKKQKERGVQASVYSHLMQQLSISITRAPIPNATYSHDVIYPVRIVDLQKIRDALYAIARLGDPAIISKHPAWQRHPVYKRGCGIPQDAQLANLQIRAWLHEQRMVGRFNARRLRDTPILPGPLSRQETDMEPEAILIVSNGKDHVVDLTDDIYDVTPQTSPRRDERPGAAPAPILITIPGNCDADSSVQETDRSSWKRNGPVSKEQQRLTKAEDQQREALQSYLAQKRPVVQEVDLDDILGPVEPVYDELWTREDEKNLGNTLTRIVPPLSNGANSTKYATLQGMWKICLQLFRCAPLAIISTRRGLAYDATMRSGVVATPTSIIWHGEFAEYFAKTLTHPIWQGDADILALFLQYCIICRTDNRRPWDFARHDHVLGQLGLKGFFEQLGRFHNRRLPTSLHDMHARFRRAETEQGNYLSIYSNLLDQIGNTVQINERLWLDVVPMVDMIYPVSLQDLMSLHAAIDAMNLAGVPMTISVEAAFERFMSIRQPCGLPKGSDYAQLSAFHVRAWLHERRMVRRYKAKSLQCVEAPMGPLSRLGMEDE